MIYSAQEGSILDQIILTTVGAFNGTVDANVYSLYMQKLNKYLQVNIDAYPCETHKANLYTAYYEAIVDCAGSFEPHNLIVIG